MKAWKERGSVKGIGHTCKNKLEFKRDVSSGLASDARAGINHHGSHVSFLIAEKRRSAH